MTGNNFLRWDSIHGCLKYSLLLKIIFSGRKWFLVTWRSKAPASLNHAFSGKILAKEVRFPCSEIFYATLTILCIWWSSRKNYLTPNENSWCQTPNRLSCRFFTCYPCVCWELILSLCHECDRGVTRVFGRWSRHRHLSNILLDPVQI